VISHSLPEEWSNFLETDSSLLLHPLLAQQPDRPDQTRLHQGRVCLVRAVDGKRFTYLAVPEKYLTPESLEAVHDDKEAISIGGGAPKLGGSATFHVPVRRKSDVARQ
jgi:hypothetical protein